MRNSMVMTAIGRGISFWVGRLALCGLVLVLPGPGPAAFSVAHAEGFFQSLFGGGAKTSNRAKRSQRRTVRRSSYGGSQSPRRQIRLPYLNPLNRNARPRRQRRQRVRNTNSGGGYSTMCVRRCDGYYFPISFDVPRSRFRRDADICRAKCPGSGMAKLYLMPSHNKPASMVDRNGRAYAKTKTAFLFRKKRVANCGCKPAPWSAEAAYRHQSYALNEPHERKLARLEGDVEFLAGLTRVRKSIRHASKAALAKAAATKLKAAMAAQFAALKRANEARQLTPADQRISSVGAGVGARLVSASTHGNGIVNGNGNGIGQRVAMTSAHASQLGQPSFGGGYIDDNAPAGFARYARGQRRRLRFSYDDGSYRFARKARRRRYVQRPRPVAVNRRRKPATTGKSKSSFWNFGNKPKYRWPGD